ncbi:MAG: YhgE/Pip family protein [Sarcina sp.]
MKNILKIFKRDIKSMVINPVALLIIGGLCIVPSLYAWVNIKACWDPYTDTSTVPVAIVNEDIGTVLNGKIINIGNDVINQLHSNTKIGWKFVNLEQASKGVLDGEYYASIEIPKEFSTDLVSLTTDNPKQAQIIYKVNTKENPVAGKITEVAESTLVNEIQTTFVQTVNEEVFTNLNGVGAKLEENKQNIINLKNAIININNNMSTITNVLESVENGSNTLGSYIDTLKNSLPEISSNLTSVQNITSNTSSIISNTNSTLSTAFNNIELNLESTKSKVDNIKNQITNINLENTSSAQTKNIISTMNNSLNTAKKSIISVVTFLEEIDKIQKSESIERFINTLNNVISMINNESDTLNMASNAIDSAGNLGKSTKEELLNGANTLSNRLENVINTYNSSVKSNLDSIGSNLESATSTAVGLIGNANGLVEKIQSVTNSASDSVNLAQSTAKELENTLNQFSNVIAELAKNLSGINDANLTQIVSILQGNPEIMGNFISQSFNVQEKVIYPIANYGSGMAPIYTVLALWVGALLLTSLLKTNPPEFEGIEKFSIRERFFGKLLTFLSITIIQSLIVTVGDKYILGVQTANLPLFIILGVITSIVFTIIIFTLVSLFGNFGKAIAIVLMVIQIAGTGGTYPIQVLPLFFRVVEPIMPFPYSVDAFREAIAGPIASHVQKDIVALIVFGIVFALLGYFLKPLLYSKLTKFEEKFEESGIGE